MLVIVVNDRFLPRNSDCPHPYGVTGFVISILRELEERKYDCRLILYRRTPGINTPYLESMQWRGFPAIRMYFDFSNSSSELRELFERCISSFACHRFQRSRAIIYHQTPTLVSLTPPDIPFIATHHGPFASEIVRLFGEEFACEAFGGNQQKLQHLIERQAEGLRFLCDRDNGVALEMSQVQEQALLRFGVPFDRIQVCPPIVHIPQPSEQLKISAHGRKPTIFTAAARLDRFKQLPILVDAVNNLYESGIDVRLVIYAGDASHSVDRKELLDRTSRGFRKYCYLYNSLSHESLLKLFNRATNRGIFVFTSIYETFGITPLESVLSGVTTIVPNMPLQVGVSSFFPDASKFDNSIEGLLGKLKEIVSQDLAVFGYAQMMQVRQTLSRKDFIDALLADNR